MSRSTPKYITITHPLHLGPTAEEDILRYSLTGQLSAFRSQNTNVPLSYELELPRNALTVNQQLAHDFWGYRQLYVVSRVAGTTQWKYDEARWILSDLMVADHGYIDIYGEWKYPGQTLEYQQIKEPNTK